MATTYDLYLESGPKRRKTMVHVLDLLGCVAVGPTTDEVLAATPEAIRAFLRFLRRNGEAIDPEAPFETRVVEHITEGGWLGNGSPYITFGPDLEPLTDEDIETHLRRYCWMREELAAWAATQSDAQLDAPPQEHGRTARSVLLHILGAVYLAGALGGRAGLLGAAWSRRARGDRSAGGAAAWGSNGAGACHRCHAGGARRRARASHTGATDAAPGAAAHTGTRLGAPDGAGATPRWTGGVVGFRAKNSPCLR